MGIDNLNKFLRDKFPSVFKRIHISQHAFKKVAVDFFIFAFRFKKAAGERWLHSLLRLVLCLRKNNLHPVFVFDSDTNKIPEKEQERKRRREKRESLSQKIETLKQALEEFEKTSIVPPQLEYLSSQVGSLSSHSFNTKVNEEIRRLESQNTTVTAEDIIDAKELFKVFKVPYLVSNTEGETLCAELCVQNKTQLILSNDTDALVYDTQNDQAFHSIVLSNLDLESGECVQVDKKEMLEIMNLTSTQFLEFCIMCGTDFNGNLPKIGPVSAFNLIKKHGSIDNLSKEVDVKPLNHVRVKELFLLTREDREKKPDVPFCGQIDQEEVKLWAFQYNIRYISLDYIVECHRPDLQFED